MPRPVVVTIRSAVRACEASRAADVNTVVSTATVTAVHASAHDAVLQSSNLGRSLVEAMSVSAVIHPRVKRQPPSKPGSTAELFDLALAALLT